MTLVTEKLLLKGWFKIELHQTQWIESHQQSDLILTDGSSKILDKKSLELEQKSVNIGLYYEIVDKRHLTRNRTISANWLHNSSITISEGPNHLFH